MLLPIKLATTKQPAKKKGKVTPVTPEEQAKGFEGLKRQAKLEEQQIAEFVAKQNYNPAEEARKRGVSVPVQSYESKLNTGVLAEPVLSGEESVAKAQTEPKVAPRVQVNKQGLVVKTIETKYGNVKYTTTPEESKIYLSSDIDAINKLTAEIAKDFEKGFREQGRKKKTETKEKYKFDEVNAALNPNFIDEQTRKGVKAFEDVLLAPLDTFGIRKSLNEVADYAKQSDNALAQFGGGILESVANPLTTFAMSTGNIADPTATTEQKVGAGFNLATYLISAIPVGEAVATSINAYRGVRGLAGVGEAINAGARSLLKSTVPGGKWIDRKVTINDLVNVLERNGQMGGKTRGQLAREFASGGKAFAKATGQAPELFYNKYLNDLADQAQPATPAQFDVTAPKAPEAPTQAEDLGAVVDDLVGKTEPETNTITVYHGTTGEFEGIPSVSMSRTGAIHVTPDKKFAENFTDINQPNAVGQVPTIKEFDLDKSKIADLSQPELKQDFIDFVVNKYGLKFDPLDPEFQTLNTRTFDPEGYNYPGGMTIDDLANDIDKGQFWVAESEAAKEWSKVKGYSGVKAIEDGSETYALFDTNALKIKTPPTSIVDEIEQGMGASKSTAPPLPTEPTVTGISEAPDEQLTSAKNRMTQEVRDEYDMGKFDEPTRRKWEESLTTAKQELQSNANAVDNVIAKIDSKRAINEAEQSVLVVALSRERRNARALLEQTNEATSAEEIATLAEQTKIAEGRIDNYTNALNRAGSETARTLNARRAVIDAAEDLVSIRAKARQTYGKALEVADEEAINEIGKGLEDINKQIDDATGKGTTPIETVKANTRVKGIKESAPVTKKSIQDKTDSKTLDNVEKKFAITKQKQIERLEKDIAITQEQLDGQFVYESEAPGKPVSPEVQALKDKLTELKKQQTQLKKDLTKTTVKSKAEILQEQIEAVQEMIRKGEIYESQPIPKTKSPEIIALEKQLAELKRVAKEISFRQGTTKPNEPLFSTVKAKLQGLTRPSTIETMGVPTEVDIWQPRLNDPASQAYFKQLASVQNDMGKVIQKLVTDEAIEDFDTLLTRLQKDGFNITDTDLKLILSADYPTTKLYDFSDIEKEYVKMVRRQLAQEAKSSSVAERGRLIKKIQDLSQKVQAGVRKTADKTVKTIFEENIDLQNRLDDLQAQYEGYANQLDKASQQERAVIQRQIDKIKEQISDPVLVDRIKREVPQNVQDLVHQREILRGELNDKLRELADKKFREEHPYLNALEVAAKVPTELLVSLDNSAAFTHGAFKSITNPLKWTKATSKSFQALISEGKYKDILASVRTRDNYDDMVRAGVAGIKQRDLQDATMYASVLQKVPYVGTLFKRSNAAMEVFGAVIRSDYFDALTEASRKEYLRGKITRAELLDRYKLQAEFVNTVTGKGIKELPKPVSVIAPFANFGMSRIKTATMTPFFNAIAKGDKVAARQFATEFFKYVTHYMGALKVAQMFGLEVGIDPRDPEYFGKIKLPGVDKWWDMSGGILEPYRILVNWKPVRNITGAEESKYKTVGDFATSKLGAPAKTAMNVFQGMTGETPYGRNYDVRTDEGRLNVLMDNLPINVKTGKELVESDKSLGAKTAEAGLQFMGARLTKDKGSKARQPVTSGETP